MKRFLSALLFAGFASGLFAQTTNLYPRFNTIIGVGGRSKAVSKIGKTPFWWIDTTGQTPGTATTGYGFEPFPAFQRLMALTGWRGSLMLSSPFTLKSGDELRVNFMLIAQRDQRIVSWAGAQPPEGFALLIKDGQMVAVLENLDLGGDRFFNNERNPILFPPDDTLLFTLPSPGVASSFVFGTNDLDVTLGTVRYVTIPGEGGPCGCFTTVSTAITPGAGTYRLLFGLYDFTEDFDFFHGALAVQSVTRVRR